MMTSHHQHELCCAVPGTRRGTRFTSSRSRNVNADDPLPTLRHRAYQLADTGRFGAWDELASELGAEGVDQGLVRRLGYDRLFQLMLKSRMDAARGA